MEFYWLEKIVILPVRRFCRGLASRLSFRKQGAIMILSREVQACEYEDVRIMWEMLTKSETNTPQVTRSTALMKNKRFRSAFAWARWGTCLTKTIT